MADDTSHYRTRAAAERTAADAATLANVRERCERSARAWIEMADRAERVTTLRHAREADTASRAGAQSDGGAHPGERPGSTDVVEPARDRP